MDSMYKLGATLTLKDIISGVLGKIAGNADKLKSKLKEIDGGVKKFESSMSSLKTGGAMFAAGTGMAIFTKNLVDTSRETSKLKAEVRGLGVESENISRISKSAVQMGYDFGISQEVFSSAAYEIRSGIDSINNAELGNFGESVVKTAVATKGATDQMSSLFGTVYNQNRKLYKDLNDTDFGKVIGNSIAFVVNAYKSDGPKIQQAIESIKGAAAAAGYDMSEQFNVLGMLQNVMPAGEAGTGLRAFVDNAGLAAQRLGMSFTNQKGKLLPVVDIIEKLKTRFGETIEVSEGMEISKAFGSDMAVSLINNLWDKTGKLKANIEALRNAKGFDFMEKTAVVNAANLDTQLKSLGETWKNFKITLGEGIGAVLAPAFSVLKSGIKIINDFAMAHPTLTKFIGSIIVLGTVIGIAGGAFMTLRGAMGLYRLTQIASTIATGAGTAATKTSIISMAAHKAALIASAVASKIVAAAQWIWNAALWACPIVWIIGGIIAIGAAIYLLVKNWDKVSAWLSGLWDRIKGFFINTINKIKGAAGAAWDWIKGIWGKAPGWVKGLVIAITAPFSIPIIMIALIVKYWNKIPEAAATAWEGVKNIWGRFADWIKGLLDKVKGFFSGIWSFLKEAGAKIITTLWEGIKSKAGELKDGIKSVFGNVWKLFSNSDAKEGPFSKLTYSGKMLIKTFNSGIEQEANKPPAVLPYMKRTMSSMQESGSRGSAPGRGGFSISISNLIGQLNIAGKSKEGGLRELTNAMAEAIMKELERYEGA